MKITRSVAEYTTFRSTASRNLEGRGLPSYPTMGALHEGHRSLIDVGTITRRCGCRQHLRQSAPVRAQRGLCALSATPR